MSKIDDRVYPCDDCDKMRSKNEGGTIFTVCDSCWDKRHPSKLKPDESRLLTDRKIAEEAIVCWEALEEHEKASFRLVAKAQRDLTASIKDAEWRTRDIEFIDWLDNGTRSCGEWRSEMRKFRQALKVK